MYAPHFGLRQEAFSIAPDPRFLHLSAQHREGLAHLLYGLQGGGGFVLLTGEIGTGKTTLCRCFLDQIPPGHRVAYVYNPKLTPAELMQTVCQEFGIHVDGAGPETLKPYVDALNRFLLQAHAQGEQCLLVVDEAQGLSTRLLEQLRLLTNLETLDRKLLQIVLIGQPELRAKLALPQLEQLSQRVIARVHLGPLTAAETVEYVQHRLAVAGLAGPLPFDRRALALVHRLSDGIPRRINLLCQRALLGAYALGTRQVDARIVRQAAHEAFGPPAPRSGRRTRRGLVVGAAAGLVTAAVLAAWASWWPGGPALLRQGVLAGAGPASASRAAGTASAASVATAAASGAAAAASAPTGWPDEQAAWQALAGDWGYPALAFEDGCAAARGQALACHEGQGDLGLLRRLDRPALLRLADGSAVLLRALGTDHARVLGRAGEQRLTWPALQAAWSGAYATWWRPPPDWAVDGERVGASVSAWALARLAALQGDARGDTRGDSRRVRDELLRQRVFAFQVSQGLPLDGVPGPLTLMQLNRTLGVAEPRLHAEP